MRNIFERAVEDLIERRPVVAPSAGEVRARLRRRRARRSRIVLVVCLGTVLTAGVALTRARSTDTKHITPGTSEPVPQTTVPPTPTARSDTPSSETTAISNASTESTVSATTAVEPPPAIAGGTVARSCSATDLSAAVSGGPGDGAMGNIKLVVTVTNTSSTPCLLADQQPTLAGVADDGTVAPIESVFGGTYFGNPPVLVGPLQAGASSELWIGGGQPTFCAPSDPSTTWSAMQLGLVDGTSIRFAPALKYCGTPAVSHFGRPSGDPGTGKVCPAALAYGDVPPTVQADLAGIMTDIQTVQDYGKAHPEDWVGFELSGDTPARIRIWVTDHVYEHAAAVAALLEHPERVDIATASVGHTELQTIADTIVADAQANPTAFTTFNTGTAGPVIAFGLAPGQETLADQYINRWGAAVRISVGGVPYVPEGCGPQPSPRACANMTGDDPADAGLALSLTTDTPTIKQSAYGHAALTVTNNGNATFHINADDPLDGNLVYPGTLRVASIDGSSRGVGVGADLAPGQSVTLNVAFSATRCDGQSGSAAPPGIYGLRVALTQHTDDGSTAPTYLSPEIQITVIAS